MASSLPAEMSTYPPVLAPILSSIKDVDSNVRSELYTLDRNIGATISAVGAETKDSVNRNADFALNDNRRNTEFVLSDANRTSNMALMEGRRNSDFILSDAHRSSDTTNSAIERNGTASVLATQTAAFNIGNSIERTGASNVLATQTAASQVGNAVERTGGASVLAVQTATGQVGNAVERNGAASVLATQNATTLLGNAVERTSAAAVLASEKAGGQILSEVIRNGAATRDLVSSSAVENRGVMEGIHSDLLKGLAASQLSAKDSDIRNADYARQGQMQSQLIGMDILRMKGDIEKQNLEIAGMAARDSAALARQAAENTAAIQLDALRNKDALSYQLNDAYRGLKSTILEVDSARLRDNQNDSRIENAFLKYGNNHGHYGHNDHHHHRRPETYIYNNLESIDRDRRPRSPPRRSRSPPRERG